MSEQMISLPHVGHRRMQVSTEIPHMHIPSQLLQLEKGREAGGSVLLSLPHQENQLDLGETFSILRVETKGPQEPTWETQLMHTFASSPRGA